MISKNWYLKFKDLKHK